MIRRRTALSVFAGGLVWVSTACGAAGPAESGSAGATPDPVSSWPLGSTPSVDEADADAGPARTDARTSLEAGAAPSDAALVVAVRRVPERLDPLGDLEPWGQRVVDDLVFDGLVRRAGDRHPFVEPALADRCIEVPSEDPKAVYCHLRDDLRFHDGNAVTTDDVVYSLSWWLDPRRSTTRLEHGLGQLRRVEVVDGVPGHPDARDPGRWIVVGFHRPEPLALERIAAMKIVPRTARRGRATSFGHQPIGTGPMRVTSLDAERLVLDRVEAQAGDDVALARRDVGVSRIVLRAIDDGAEALSLLRRGEVHVLAQMSPVHIPDELGKPGMDARFTAWLLTPPRYELLMYNLRHGAQAGPRLRSALDLAAPRTEVARLHPMPSQPVGAPVDLHDPTPIDLQALREAGVSATWGMAGLPDPVDPQRAEQDRARAAAMLDELGWTIERSIRRRGGANLRLTLMWTGGARASERGTKVAAAVRDGWRELGVQVPNATAGWGYISGLMRRGEFELGLAVLAMASDADLFEYFHSGGELNLTGVSDPDLDAALEGYRHARDRASRHEAEVAIAERLEALRPVSVLYAPTEVMLISRRVEGLEFVDDLPILDRVVLGPESRWLAGPG